MPVQLADATHPPDPASWRHLQCSVARYDALVQEAEVRGRLGGTLMLVGQTANQAQREYAALLRADAARTVQQLDAELNAAGAALGDTGRPPPPCA